MEKFEERRNEFSRVWAFVKKSWEKSIYRIIAGGLLGAGAGWLYWTFIGCNGGSCPLTSNAPQTILIFSLFGMWYNYRK